MVDTTARRDTSEPEFTIQHEPLVSSVTMPRGACAFCGALIDRSEQSCVRIAMPRRRPMRLHDDCFVDYLRGLALFTQDILGSRRAPRAN